MQQSLRVHLLDAHLQPRVSDCRDLLGAMMGREYDHTVHLLDIVEHIVKFDELLYALSEDYLSLQRMGRFHLGDSYFYDELAEMYSSLTLLKDHLQKKSTAYIGISDTHFLIFKEIVEKQSGRNAHSPLKHHHSLIVHNLKQL